MLIEYLCPSVHHRQDHRQQQHQPQHRRCSQKHIYIMYWGKSLLIWSVILSPKRNGPVYMIWFQYNWATLIIINLSVFLECLSCCVSQKKSALGASTMRGPCVSLLSAAHRGRPPLTPWYTGTQQLGPLGGAGRWHQQRRLFPALHNAHTLFFLLPWRCEWAEKVCLSRWNEKANIKLCNNFFSFRLIS